VKLHDLKPAPGSTKRRIRVGRGIAAGRGKTAGRGTKGQKARAGASIPGWFEGGQTPIHVRVPKLRGFKPVARIDYQVVNVGRISEYAAAGRFGTKAGSKPVAVDAQVLAAAGLIAHPERPVKVLGDGDVTVKVAVTAEAFTAAARSKIEGAGGSVEALAPVAEPVTEPTATEPTAEEPAAPAVEAPAAPPATEAEGLTASEAEVAADAEADLEASDQQAAE
jgi:large subunit ribosomal protein L15